VKQNHRGTYPPDWKPIRDAVRAAAGHVCIRCGMPHQPKLGYALTVHHLDCDKSNCRWWNLVSLCQRCHLKIQGRVILDRPWVLTEHTDWFKPYVAGFYAFKYLGEDLSREQTMARLDELLGLERRAVLGVA
jgi:5-methylcytosine-specific restriction endonuclease McrA